MNSLKTAVRITCFSPWALQLSQPPHPTQQKMPQLPGNAKPCFSLCADPGCEMFFPPLMPEFSWNITTFSGSVLYQLHILSFLPISSFFFLSLSLSHNQLLFSSGTLIPSATRLIFSFSSLILRNPQLSLPFKTSSSHSSWPEWGLCARLCTCLCVCVCLPVWSH